MRKFARNLVLASGISLSAFAAAADPLSPQQVECMENILRDTYPNLDEFDHSVSETGQERLNLNDGSPTNKSEIIFWNGDGSPDFSIHRYESTEEGDWSATIGSGKRKSGFNNLRQTQRTPTEEAAQLEQLRNRIRDEDCSSNQGRDNQPALLLG